MTENRRIFVRVNDKVKAEMKMGNEICVQAIGRGTIHIQPKVLNLSILDKNLLIFKQLVENRYAIYFQDDYYTIYHTKEEKKLIPNVRIEKEEAFDGLQLWGRHHLESTS